MFLRWLHLGHMVLQGIVQDILHPMTIWVTDYLVDLRALVGTGDHLGLIFILQRPHLVYTINQWITIHPPVCHLSTISHTFPRFDDIGWLVVLQWVPVIYFMCRSFLLLILKTTLSIVYLSLNRCLWWLHLFVICSLQISIY